MLRDVQEREWSWEVPGPQGKVQRSFPLSSYINNQEDKQEPNTRHTEWKDNVMQPFLIHILLYTVGTQAYPSLFGFPWGHLSYGQERVKGIVWASYKFPISVGRAGLLARRGLGWGGEGELGKSQEVVSR